MLLFFRDKGFLTIFYGCFSQAMLYGAYLIMMTFYVTDFLGGKVSHIPLFLIGIGLSSIMLGYFSSRHFDRTDDAGKRRLMLMLACANMVYFVLPFVDNLWWALLLNCTVASMGGLVFQILLSYTKLDSVRWGQKRHLSAMTHRSASTLGFTLGCAIGGVILEFYGFQVLFFCIGAMGISMVALSQFMPTLPAGDTSEKSLQKSPQNSPEKSKDTNLDFTSANPSLKVTLLVLFLCHVSISALIVNLPLHVVSLGGGPDESGYAMGVATAVEFFMLLAMSYVLARMASRMLLMVIAVCMTGSMFALGMTQSIMDVYTTQLFVGISLGLLMGGGLTIAQGEDAKMVGKRTFYYQTTVKLGSSIGNLCPYLVAWGLTPAMNFKVIALFPLMGFIVIVLWQMRCLLPRYRT